MKFIKTMLLVFAVFMVGSITGVNAQNVVRKAKDSTVIGTKYITILNTKKGATSFTLIAKKDTGTIAATITLERRTDTIPTSATSVWKQYGSQSLTLTNTTNPQGDIFPITLQDGVSYRFKVVTTGGKSYLWASYLYW